MDTRKLARKELALEYRAKGLNCAQSVVLAFKDLVNYSEEELLKITQGFGTGIGGSTLGTCGAITGADIIINLMSSDRPTAMKRSKELIERFYAQNGSVTCRVLKGIDTGKVLRTCNDAITDAVVFTEEILK